MMTAFSFLGELWWTFDVFEVVLQIVMYIRVKWIIKKERKGQKQNGDMLLQIGSRLDWGRFECELAVNCMIGEIQNMKIK